MAGSGSASGSGRMDPQIRIRIRSSPNCHGSGTLVPVMFIHHSGSKWRGPPFVAVLFGSVTFFPPQLPRPSGAPYLCSLLLCLLYVSPAELDCVSWRKMGGGDTIKTTAKISSYVLLYIAVTLLKWIIQRPCFSSACSAILWQQGLPPINRKICGLAGLNLQYMFGMISCLHIAVYLGGFPCLWMDPDGSYPWSCQWLVRPPPSL